MPRNPGPSGLSTLGIPKSVLFNGYDLSEKNGILSHGVSYSPYSWALWLIDSGNSKSVGSGAATLNFKNAWGTTGLLYLSFSQ